MIGDLNVVVGRDSAPPPRNTGPPGSVASAAPLARAPSANGAREPRRINGCCAAGFSLDRGPAPLSACHQLSAARVLSRLPGRRRMELSLDRARRGSLPTRPVSNSKAPRFGGAFFDAAFEQTPPALSAGRCSCASTGNASSAAPAKIDRSIFIPGSRRSRWWRSRLRSETGGSEQGRSILRHSADGGLMGARREAGHERAKIQVLNFPTFPTDSTRAGGKGSPGRWGWPPPA